jgi:cytochrome c oxidase subunit 1
VINFFYSIYRGKKLTKKNPWGATTLEWTTPIMAGHGNWPGKLPVVHRWAYDYSTDDKAEKDFIQQHVPLREGEVSGEH